MEYIHSKDYFEAGDVVVVNCSHQCQVLLMDNTNYDKFRSGQKFERYGGSYDHFPVKLQVPKSDTWNIILDFGDASVVVKHSIEVIRKS